MVDRTDVVLKTNLWGNPVDWEIAGPNVVIEDASQALGSKHRDGVPCGALGSMSVLSFNVNKIVTTGGGGALLTDDDAWADMARHLIGQARDRKTAPAGFVHDAMGYNYRMPNVCAALGIEQLSRLDDRIWRRMALCNALRDALKVHDGVEVVQPPPWSKSNYWIPVLRTSAAYRGRLIDELRQIGAVRKARGMPALRDGLVDVSVYAAMLERIQLLRDQQKSCNAEQHAFLCNNKPFDAAAARARIKLLYDEECDILVRLRQHQIDGVDFEFVPPPDAQPA
jgi:dTDP-4-amino-4,6-dideoxygalactose transaminase